MDRLFNGDGWGTGTAHIMLEEEMFFFCLLEYFLSLRINIYGNIGTVTSVYAGLVTDTEMEMAHLSPNNHKVATKTFNYNIYNNIGKRGGLVVERRTGARARGLET